MSRREIGDARGAVYCEIVWRELLFGPGLHPAIGQRLTDRADIEVLGDGELRHERVVLIYGGEPEALGLRRVRRGQPITEDFDRAIVRRQRAARDLEQRALARAVLAEHRVDLAGHAVEADIAERLDSGEALGDP